MSTNGNGNGHAHTSATANELLNGATMTNQEFNIAQALRDEQGRHGVMIIEDSVGAESDIVRYPITPKEFTIENLVNPTLRNRFAFTEGLSEFSIDRTINPMGIFVALIAMRVNYKKDPHTDLFDMQLPLHPSIVSAVSSDTEEKEGKKIILPFGDDDQLIKMPPHGLFSVPFGKKDFDWPRSMYVPSFTKERRRQMLVLASQIVDESAPNTFSQAVVELARKVKEQGPKELSYKGDHSEQDQLLVATGLKDNMTEIFFANVFGGELKRDSELAGKLNESRRLMADRFHRIAIAAKVPQGEIALFCIVGYANRIHMQKSKNTDKYPVNTARVRTFSKWEDPTSPIGFIVGVQALSKSGQLSAISDHNGSGSYEMYSRIPGYKDRLANLTLNAEPLKPSTLAMEQERLSELKLAEIKEAAIEEIAASSSAKATVSVANKLSVEEAQAETEVFINIERNVAQQKAEVSTKDLVFKANERVARVFLTHVACLQGLGVKEHPLLGIFESAKKAIDGAGADKSKIATEVKAMEEAAKGFYKVAGNVTSFIEVYEKATSANVDLVTALNGLESSLKLGRPDAIVAYVKQVAVSLRFGLAGNVNNDKVVPSKKVYEDFITNVLFTRVRSGQSLSSASLETFIAIQKNRTKDIEVDGKKVGTTVGNLIDTLIAEVFGNDKHTEKRVDQLKKIEDHLASLTPSATPTVAPAVVVPPIKVVEEVAPASQPASIAPSPANADVKEEAPPVTLLPDTFKESGGLSKLFGAIAKATPEAVTNDLDGCKG